MASRVPNLTLVAPDQSGKEYTINHALNALSPSALFARRDAECSGLAWYYHGGTMIVDGVATVIANNASPLTLTASATNYIYATRTGSVSASTSGFPAGSIPLYTAVTGTSTVTDYSDVRAFGAFPGQIAIGTASAASGDVTLNAVQARLDYLSITGALTANRAVIVPNQWRGCISNETSGAFTVTVKTAAGSGVTVSQGQRSPLLADGTNVVELGGSGGGTSGAAILAGQAGGQKLIGGTAASDKLELQATAGAATSGDGIVFRVGSNGATVAAAIRNDGLVQVSSGATSGLVNVGGQVYAAHSSSDAVVGEAGTGTAIFGRSVSGYGGQFWQSGDLSANNSNPVLKVARWSTGAFNVTGDVVIIDDSPENTGSKSGMLLRGFCDGLTRVSLNPRVTDGASAVAHFLSTANTLSDAAAKLLSIRNVGSEKFAIKANGRLVLTVPADYADDAAAATGGIAIGEVYRTGSVLKVRVA